MKRTFYFFLITVSINSSAQSVSSSGAVFYLNPLETKIDPSLRSGVYIGPHIMGDSVTEKRNVFESKYIFYKKSGGAYPSEEKVVLKPSIYKALIKIDKEFTKRIEEKPPLAADYKKRMTTLYDIGIKLVRYQTDKVEKEVRSLKSADDLESYFLSLQFK
jgi:hypothetical protein